MRYRVPEVLVSVALELAQSVERGEIGRQVAYERLTNQHGFAGHTANAYLNCYAHLRAGTPMKATVNAAGLRLMLKEVAAMGSGDLFLALQALLGHILYLEGLPNSTSIERGLRYVHQEYTGRLVAQAGLALPPATFDDKVRLSLADSAEERKRRLAQAKKKPKLVVRMVRDYERNPDVVAEVLARAQGVCEGCSTAASFKRRSNGTPYLEVHHIVQLAHDGEDTVDNAQALCPNCHRERHFGQVEEPVSAVSAGLSSTEAS